MCAEAIFSDQSGDPAGQFMRAAEFGQNFMQRRQRQQWESEDRTENQRVRTLFEPVLQAQRQAQVATALSSLETNKQQQQLRTRFAAEAPKYDKLYQDAMALPTFEAQEAALAQIQPQVTWMGLIPEGQGFVDAVNNSRALAFKSTMADKQINGTIAEVNAKRAAELAAIAARGSEARMTVLQQGLQNRMTNSARPANNTFQRDAQRIIYLQQQADALREVDPETASYLEKRAAYLSNPSSGGSDSFDLWVGGTGQPGAAPVTNMPAVSTGPVTAPTSAVTTTLPASPSPKGPYRLPATVKY